MGNYAAAIQDYSAAISVDPDNSYALYNRGITRDRMADLEGAIADFTAAALLNPNNADFYHNRGFSHRKLVRGCLTFQPVAEAYLSLSHESLQLSSG